MMTTDGGRLGVALSWMMMMLNVLAVHAEVRLRASVVESLVRSRCAARSARDFATADLLKLELEAGGVKLQDETGGGTSWRYKLLKPADGPGGSPVIALARRALDLHDDAHALRLVCDQALKLCDSGEPLLGRTAADAAFDFAIAGCASTELISALAEAQSLEFARWRKPQPLASMQICERLIAAGIGDGSAVLDRAVTALSRDGGAHAGAVQSIRELSFGHPRPLRWLWRRAASLRKVDPPADSDASSAVASALGCFSEPARPLVLDLGCGFGTSLLSLGRLGSLPHAIGSPLQERCNLLGCDGSSLKTSFAAGTSNRWDISSRVQFARASAELTLARASCSDSRRLAGVIVQFPTPFRVDGGGNSQLPQLYLGGGPTPSANQYMLPRSLVEDVAHALRDSAGWFFFQSNVEDVACIARAMAEDAGMRLVATDEAAAQAVASEVPAHAPTVARAGNWRSGAGGAETSGSLRHARLQRAGVVSPTAAVGPGWLSCNPLGVLTETEAALELDGRRIHRFLAVVRQ